MTLSDRQKFYVRKCDSYHGNTEPLSSNFEDIYSTTLGFVMICMQPTEMKEKYCVRKKESAKIQSLFVVFSLDL